jgi:hypothetical protein
VGQKICIKKQSEPMCGCPGWSVSQFWSYRVVWRSSHCLKRQSHSHEKTVVLVRGGDLIMSWSVCKVLLSLDIMVTRGLGQWLEKFRGSFGSLDQDIAKADSESLCQPWTLTSYLCLQCSWDCKCEPPCLAYSLRCELDEFLYLGWPWTEILLSPPPK